MNQSSSEIMKFELVFMASGDVMQMKFLTLNIYIYIYIYIRLFTEFISSYNEN